MGLNGDTYEYIAVYVDDLLIAAKDPLAITKCLEETHLFKLKGIVPLKYHLGCNYFRDDNGTLCFGPRKYIEKMMDQYGKMFGKKQYTSPAEKSDHPDTDTTDKLDLAGIKIYQSMIGSLQRAIALGQFNIQTATMRVRVNEPDFSTFPVQEFDWAETGYGKVQNEIPKDIPGPYGKPVVYVH
jgi:hypothetical protein